jgi:hypothetical protein
VSDEIAIINLQAYADAKTDPAFYGKNMCISPPDILHSVRDFRHQPKMNGKANLKSRVVSRARMMTFAAFSFWTKFGQDSVNSFGIDHHGNAVAFRTPSLLAFKSVWTRFALLGGPLAQSPERMKPHYVEMLRLSLRGGFMFSAQKYVESDGRKSIMEFDLSSAYGFSASNALMPSGFCPGLLNLSSSGGGGGGEDKDANAIQLVKTDARKRHRSFEFLAVYYTLRCFQTSGPKIQTVYSNFSPIWIFYLKRYPADLVIIFKTGKVMVYQFDGNYFHGCNICPPGKRYVHRQTHEQVRSKTIKIDNVFK